jgi:prepilin-type N-terminal cleavage/methylation domain-containing protein/prepilin-type processing-associated H-X9-DG protein
MAAGVQVATEERSMRRAGRSAFTLIELLVVVAVMAVLAAILVPVLAWARDGARRARCLSNLRQIALAHRIYVQDHDDVLPSWYSRSPQGHLLWPEFLRPYYREPRLLDDGADRGKAPAGSMWLADYALCAWGAGGKGTRAEPYWRWPGAPPVDPSASGPMTMAEVRRPAEVMQFADGVTQRNSRFSSACSVQRRHQEGALHGAFLDGHARLVRDAEWQVLGWDEAGFFYRLAAADR